MKKTFKFFLVIFLIILILLAYDNKDNLYLFYRDNILKVKDNIKLERNSYYRDNDYLYVQNTNDFVSKSYNDTLNIIYSIINSGVSSFTFYCDNSYNTCIRDVENILDNNYILSSINNYVHPYNSFEVIKASYDSYGKITLNIIKAYTEKEINLIEDKVNEIINKNPSHNKKAS